MKFGKAFIVPFILFGLVIAIILIGILVAVFGVASADHAGSGAMLIAMAVGGGGAIYLLPAFIAGIRDAPNYSLILLINILAGWTVLGWIAMAIWAIMDKAERPVVVHHVYHDYPRQSGPPPLP